MTHSSLGVGGHQTASIKNQALSIKTQRPASQINQQKERSNTFCTKAHACIYMYVTLLSVFIDSSCDCEKLHGRGDPLLSSWALLHPLSCPLRRLRPWGDMSTCWCLVTHTFVRCSVMGPYFSQKRAYPGRSQVESRSKPSRKHVNSNPGRIQVEPSQVESRSNPGRIQVETRSNPIRHGFDLRAFIFRN